MERYLTGKMRGRKGMKGLMDRWVDNSMNLIDAWVDGRVMGQWMLRATKTTDTKHPLDRERVLSPTPEQEKQLPPRDTLAREWQESSEIGER